MSKERIYLQDDSQTLDPSHHEITWSENRIDECGKDTEYVRADLYAKLQVRVKELEDALREYGIRGHYTCEDAFYSCPASGKCYREDRTGECECGSDEHNAKVDQALRGKDG